MKSSKMPFAVYILRATNGSDFNAGEKLIAAVSQEECQKQFEIQLKQDWNEADIDDLQFYKDYDSFSNAWRTEINYLVLYPLPKPGE